LSSSSANYQFVQGSGTYFVSLPNPVGNAGLSFWFVSTNAATAYLQYSPQAFSKTLSAGDKTLLASNGTNWVQVY
jgi:hypothetical protein